MIVLVAAGFLLGIVALSMFIAALWAVTLVILGACLVQPGETRKILGATVTNTARPSGERWDTRSKTWVCPEEVDIWEEAIRCSSILVGSGHKTLAKHEQDVHGFLRRQTADLTSRS